MELPFAGPVPGLPAGQAAAPYAAVPYAASASCPAGADGSQAAIVTCPALRVPGAYI